MIRIAFFGQGQLSSKILALIASANEEFSVLAVVPRLTGRGNFFDGGILNDIAEENNLPIFVIPNVNKDSFLVQLEELDLDLACNCGHGQLFGEKLLQIPKLGCFNYHPGLLPYGRGSGAIVGEMINGVTKVGRTCHLMSEKFDMGKIVNQEEFTITSEQTMGEISNVLSNGAEYFYLESIRKLVQNDTLIEIKQFGRYFPKFVAGDEYIDWNQPSQRIINKVNARIPERAAITYLTKDLKEIHVHGVESEPNIENYISVNGQVIDKSGKGILVKTGDNAIWVTSISCEASEMFIPSYPIGTCFETVNIYEFIKLLKFCNDFMNHSDSEKS